jgi:hypothetical protein
MESMEVVHFKDSCNQRWNVTKERYFSNKKGNRIYCEQAWFKKEDTQIHVWDPCHDYIYGWDIIDNKYLGKIEESADSDISESVDDDFLIVDNKLLLQSEKDSDEFPWFYEISKELRGWVRRERSDKATVAWHPDMSVAYVWDKKEKKQISVLPHTNKIKNTYLYESGKIITISDDGCMNLWNTKGDILLKVTFDRNIVWATFNQKETQIVFVTDDGKIRLLVKEQSI